MADSGVALYTRADAFASLSGRAHIYCRVSSAAQEDGYSLDTQEAACRTFAAERGLVVASVAREVWSGGDRHRPELEALFGRLASGYILVAYALDRFSRSQIDTAILIDRIEADGASLQLVTEDFEKSATGTFLRNAKAFAAELEREKIAERTQRGRRARIDSGKPFVSGAPPYGYLWNADKSAYVLDPVTAPIARIIFDKALAGESLRGIALQLAGQGVPSPSGKGSWRPTTIHRILTRPIYSGDHVAYRDRYERRPGGGYVRRTRLEEERIVLPGVAPAIVTKDEQATIVSRLKLNKAQSPRHNMNPEKTLLRAGFVRCGYCGWALGVNNHATSKTRRAPQCRCYSHGTNCPHATIAASILDHAVWEKVAAVLSDPDIIADEVAKLRHDGGLERDIASVERQLAGIGDKQARIAKRVADLEDDAVAAPLMEELKSLAALRKTSEQQRDELQHRIADRQAEEAQVKSLAAWCATVNANLEALTYEERRLALLWLGVDVRVYPAGAVDEQGDKLPRWEITMRPDVPNGVDSVSLYQ